MASPEEKLITAVSPLCAGRLFPDFAPLGTPRPYAIWQQVGGNDVVFVDGDTADQLGVRFQIEVWADTRQQASMLMRQIASTLSAPPVLAESQGGAAARTDDANLRGSMQDFIIWGDA